MNGKDIELSNKINKFIKIFKKNNPNIKADIVFDDFMKFNVDFAFGVDEKEQQEELQIIEKAYLYYFGKKLKNQNLVRVKLESYVNYKNDGKLDYSYRYEI